MTTYVATFCRADGIALEVKEKSYEVQSFEQASAAAVVDLRPGWALTKIKPKLEIAREPIFNCTLTFPDQSAQPIIYRDVRLIEAQRLVGCAFEQRGAMAFLVKKQ